MWPRSVLHHRPGFLLDGTAFPATPDTLANPANTVNRDMCGLTGLTGRTLVDMGKLDPDDSRPPYRQIADALRVAIESGELAPGERLPALPALTSEYDVSIGTAKSALAVLRDAGLIVTRQGKGSYVRTRTDPDSDVGAPADLDDLRRAVRALSARLDAVERQLADQ